MLRDDNAPLLLGCPGRDDLDAFANGELEPHKQEAVAEHLCGCASCESSLQALRGEETALHRLRLQPDPMFLLDATQWEPLAARARGIPAEHPGTATVTDAGSRKHTAEGPPLPIIFGGYVLLERLGRGGMGIVYKARQEALKRMVALKMVRAGVYASPEERTRFRREGEVVARVQHANVVQIYEFSEHEGQLYFSMELLHGGTLESKVHDRPLPEREAAQLVRTLALAVHAAHQQGVVHRDLKPANVLFAADNTVKITDFGLAKVLDADGSDTRSDAILGTPAYMAPEQARGEIRTVGPAADVYALGAILYETLTGRPPFRAETRYQTLELVRTGEPAAPSGLRRGLSRDLEAICLKCLEKGQAQRYGSAGALADDLDRWLRGESPLVRPTTGLRRGWRAVRRHPRVAVALAVVLMLAVTIPATLWYRDPERPIKRIEEELAQGKAQTLIGETGKPLWFSFTAGGGNSQTSVARNGVFTVQTRAYALVELVRNPRLERYRLRAEVRHAKADRSSAVGIYVGDRQFPAPRGTVHSFVQWTFDDINDRRTRFAQLKWKGPNQRPPNGNVVSLQSQLLIDEDPLDPRTLRYNEKGGLFEPAPPGRPDWRPIAVEVTPQGVRGFWGGKLFCELPADLAVERLKEHMDAFRKDQPDNNPFAEVVVPKFAPRGGAGLYVYNGSASFRRVVIDPLEKSE